MACCSAKGCDVVFDERMARRLARQYRRKGLERAGERVVARLRERGLAGATVLDIGGGVGAIGLELLAGGAERATTVELSAAYRREATALARDRGVADRVEMRVADLGEDPGAVEPADFVVLHRVVCCYPDHERLLAAAAGLARRALVFSYPPRNVLVRPLLAVQNAWHAARGREFRVYAHSPEAMLAAAQRGGLRRAGEERAGLWRVAALDHRGAV